RFYDEDFPQLFRVRADLDSELQRSDEAVAAYAAFVAGQVRQLGLRHFRREAGAKVAEYGAPLGGQQAKSRAACDERTGLLAEASYCAGKARSSLVGADHVTAAIDRKVYRSGLVEAKLREMTSNGTILIDTTGSRTGQVNGLSVLDMGDYSFGRPVR